MAYLARRICRDTVGSYVVSTVRLGEVYEHYIEVPTWETLVFGDGLWDEYEVRYKSVEDAIAGHNNIVEEIKKNAKPIPKRVFLED
jgi:hypothetical protein